MVIWSRPKMEKPSKLSVKKEDKPLRAIKEEPPPEYLSKLSLVRDVVNTLLDPKVDAVLIHGPGGTGKTTLTRDVLKYLSIHHPEKEIAVTASTGAAAVNLLPKSLSTNALHATTLHSWAGIGLGQGSAVKILENIRKRWKVKRKWTDTDV